MLGPPVKCLLVYFHFMNLIYCIYHDQLYSYWTSLQNVSIIHQLHQLEIPLHLIQGWYFPLNPIKSPLNPIKSPISYGFKTETGAPG